MPNLKISQAALHVPAPTDQIPVETDDDTNLTASHVTVAGVHAAIPPATEAARGSLLTASSAEIAAAEAADLVVTPARLARSIRKIHLITAPLYIGQVLPTTTAATIYTTFTNVFGRPPGNGEIFTFLSSGNRLLLGVLESASGSILCFNLTLSMFQTLV